MTDRTPNSSRISNAEGHILNRVFCCLLDLDQKRLLDESFRYYFQFKLLLLIFGVLSLLIGIMNFFTAGFLLAIVDITFSTLCFIQLFILRVTQKAGFIHYIVFACLLIGFMVILLVTGGTEGYGSYWILLLPTCGMSLLGLKRGVALSAVMLLISAMAFWVPFFRELCQYEYSYRYRVVFLILYAAFFLAGYCIETLRTMCYQEMLNVQKMFQNASEKDALTGIANRIWFNKHFIDKYDGKPVSASSVAFLIDIDDFKFVNDMYGHLAGDEILCRAVDTVRAYIGDTVLCRWGGEEFFAFVPSCDSEHAEALLEKIRKSVEQTIYCYKEYSDIKITISIGAVYIEKNTVMDTEKILCEVDRQLYQSKAQGKNRVNVDGRKLYEK